MSTAHQWTDDSRKFMLSSDVFLNIRAALERGDHGNAAIHAAISSCNIIKEFAKHGQSKSARVPSNMILLIMIRRNR